MALKTDIATRASAITLKYSGKTTDEVALLVGISSRQVSRIWAKAIERGFDPAAQQLLIRDEFLTDAPRSGRPRKQKLS
ncbi:hypothetical protein CDD81_2437 [Ophiocordyceps australis]|uniref:Uncharacterized protein n=1 Tax=Ophiocordyceps australis TaxID=1399860 RepID=A0A2C5XEN7_9HYPO|nr:hypothetical protein CDD81_2437 [Ophiocordyceps australis]